MKPFIHPVRARVNLICETSAWPEPGGGKGAPNCGNRPSRFRAAFVVSGPSFTREGKRASPFDIGLLRSAILLAAFDLVVVTSSSATAGISTPSNA